MPRAPRPPPLHTRAASASVPAHSSGSTRMNAHATALSPNVSSAAAMNRKNMVRNAKKRKNAAHARSRVHRGA